MTMVETVTGGRGDPSGVAYVLETLYRRQQGLEEDNWVTKEMTALLKKKLSKVAAPFLTLAEYKPVGSTAEKLSVSRKDDKDLLLVLGPPYSPAYFKSEYDAHGRHFLKWNNKKCQGTKPRYVGNGNYLSATALRTFINGCLQTAVKDERVGSLRVGKVEVWKQAVRVHLKQEGGGRQTFIVDIIPQIKGDQWRRVAGVEPLESLAPALQKAIQGVEAAGEASVMFSLFGPPGTPPHTLTTCYALLEREFFLKNEALRNIALLSKVILTGHNWKKRFGLKVAHFKRLIMAKSEQFSSITTWQGVSQLLSLAETQLRDGCLEGFPDHDCNLMWHKTDEGCHAIARAIADVTMTLDPHYLAMYLI